MDASAAGTLGSVLTVLFFGGLVAYAVIRGRVARQARADREQREALHRRDAGDAE